MFTQVVLGTSRSQLSKFIFQIQQKFLPSLHISYIEFHSGFQGVCKVDEHIGYTLHNLQTHQRSNNQPTGHKQKWWLAVAFGRFFSCQSNNSSSWYWMKVIVPRGTSPTRTKSPGHAAVPAARSLSSSKPLLAAETRSDQAPGAMAMSCTCTVPLEDIINV